MIWLLRHGEAEDEASDDAARRLTENGKEQARAAGMALRATGVRPEAVLTSPKVRARETAEIAAGLLAAKVTETDALRGGDFDPHQVASGHDEVLLVGHEPDLSRAVQATTGARAEIEKGGLVGIEGNVLLSVLRPDEIRLIAEVE